MSTKLNTHQILVDHYARLIRSEYRWSKIVSEANDNVQRNEWGEKYGRIWLGDIMSVYPSGKVYAFWTTNQTSSDVRRDEAFGDALHLVAKENNGFITHEDDGIFFEIPALDEATNSEDEMADAEYFDVNE